ncbi:MAG: hypothetical protein QOK06_355 [Acidimicrobiaceae bacterium]
MLTRQGWLVGGFGVAVIVLGRVFGVLELFVVGAASIALVAVALVLVNITRLRLAVARQVTPPRVYAGSPSRVELSVRNDSYRPTPVLRLFDPVTGTRGAEVLVAPLQPDDTTRAAYRLPTDKRGIVRIGPLEVVVSDPFGVAASSIVAAPVTELTVFPHIDDIVPVPHTSGYDPHAGAEHPSALGRSGEDFYALRPYVVGDDLRRVHWPSTARRDELMVRQDELPWQGRVTVLLDVRRSAHTPASLELAVSAAASIVTASWKRRDLVRFATTEGTDFGFGAGTPHAEAIMEHLATVPASAGGTLRGMVEAVGRDGGSGALVVVLASVAESELIGLRSARGRHGSLTVVQFDRSCWDPTHPAPAGAVSSALVIATRELPFVDAWNRAMHPRARATRHVTGVQQ